jgi:osmoprotectant transport system ATP-binding protein
MLMFELNAIEKHYGQTVALGGVDLSVEPEQTTVLIGPSGCGKSTLLRVMVRLIEPDAGTVRFEDQPLDDDSILQQRRRMGYVIQEGGLFPHLSARRNATLMPEYLGWSRERMEDRLRELAELTHFPQEGLERYPAQLSGGQRQRVSLMRALMLDPHALLLDEPLGALDPMIRTSLQRELREIFRKLNKTVVMVTHDLEEAVFFGDRIVLMRDGQIVQQGAFEDLTQRPADPFVTEFVKAQRGPLQDNGEPGT